MQIWLPGRLSSQHPTRLHNRIASLYGMSSKKVAAKKTAEPKETVSLGPANNGMINSGGVCLAMI
jgi:hypothetical protein